MLPNASGKRALRILLADRSEETRDLFTTLFAAMGHEVQSVTTMADALRAAPRLRPHAIFTAIFLPDGSGFDLCAALRTLPETSGALIVAITGYRSADADRLAQEAGFDHYLVKPVKLDTILDTMKAVAGSGKPATAPSAT